MNVDALHALADRWREEAALLRRRGLTEAATMVDSFADELVDAVEAWRLEALPLSEAVRESGLSYSTLQQRIASGDLPNVGRRGAPRIRRADLPRRGTRVEKSPDGPDVAAEVLANRGAVSHARDVPPELLLYTAKQAADLLGTKPGTLANWRYTGKGPAFVRIGGRVKYKASDLQAWLQAQRRRSTSDPGPE